MSILVIGDLMCDRYVFGDVDRLSQEAPVPVVRWTREECRAGAAANVAMNVKSLGSDVTLVGIIGDDESGTLLHDILKQHGIATELVSDSIRTTQKLRIIGRNQQIVRVDFEADPKASINYRAIEQIAKHDIIVFSDYGKGALREVRTLIRDAKRDGKTVLVDPKGYDYSRYYGADLVKPNLDEMRAMVGGWADENQLLFKAEHLRAEANVGAVLLTRGSGGMSLYERTGVTHIPAKALEVYDVTGAGDTVMAATAVALQDGRYTLRDAVAIANYAAGVAVAHFGTYAVTRAQLDEAIRGQ